MPLVKAGKVVADRFVRVLDDAPAPETGSVIVPAARFLAEARACFEQVSESLRHERPGYECVRAGHPC